MEVTKLNVNVREKSGRGVCNSLRKSHRIPGILYGKNAENFLVEFSEMEISDILKNYGENAVVNLDMNGVTKKAIIKEVQRDPVSRNLSHIDLKYIKDDEKVHADVPVVIKGEDRVRSKGGIVQKQLGVVSVESTPDRLPKYLSADVSKLDIGQKLTLADMEFSADITVLSDLHSVIATVTTAKEKETMLDEGEQQRLDSTLLNAVTTD